MKEQIDWSDYRVVLDIAEAGSLAAAARRSNLSHPTMFRRLNTVEERLGVRLFERFRNGYLPTPAGEEMVAAARDMAERAVATERKLSGRDLRPSGSVRVTTTDTLLFGLLGAEFARLRDVEPEIALEIVVSNEVFDLSLREADVAIRPAARPEPHLVGRKLGVIRQAVYGHKDLDRNEHENDKLANVPWIGPSRSMAYDQLYAWMIRKGYDKVCGCRVDSLLGIHAAVRAGIGAAVLPAYLGEADTALRRYGGFVDELDTDLWLLVHPDLRHTARIRCVMDCLSQSAAIRRTLTA